MLRYYYSIIRSCIDYFLFVIDEQIQIARLKLALRFHLLLDISEGYFDDLVKADVFHKFGVLLQVCFEFFLLSQGVRRGLCHYC